jgi:hypothetical protein
VQLQTRQGYWTPTSETLRAAVAAMPTAAVNRLPPWPTRISPLIRPWFGTTRGDNGRTRVSFAWEPAGSVPVGRTRSASPARIILKAMQPDGTLLFEGEVRRAGATEVAADRGRTASFELPPGRVRLQMSIEDATSTVLDTDMREITVNAIAGPLAFGTPQVFRARTAREFRAIAANPDAPPAPSREFSRAERLLIRAHLYADAGDPTLSARLVSGLGGPMREVAATPGSAPGVFDLDVPLAGLPVGEYRIALAARAPDGTEASDVIVFRVTP